MPSRYALIIGNSEYIDGKLAKLRTPDSDVDALADVLLNTSMGNFDNVEVLLNRDSATVRKAITQFFSNKKRDDLLLLYFSGHGVLDDRGRLFLAVKDTEHHLLRGTSLPAGFVTDEMDNCNSNRQILILDCCHSGAFARGTKGAIGASVGTSSAFMGNGYGRIVLTATDSTEYAWEGDELLGSKQNSVFTHYLIKGIQTGLADLNHDGMISIDELYDYAHDCVSGSTSKQTPGKWSFKQQGEIIISINPSTEPGLVESQKTARGEEIKQSDLVGPSLSTKILKSGIAGGLIATLLLLYPMYVYIPSLYASGWYKGYGILAYLLMLLALVPIAWSGWLVARWAKTGWEAIFLGAQAGTIASSIAFLSGIAMASGVSAFGSVLKILPRFLSEPSQVVAAIALPYVALFTHTLYTWIAVESIGLLLGSLGCLFHMKRSNYRIRFSGFQLTFDVYWWKMILGGVVSAALILALSSAGHEMLVDQVTNTAQQAGQPVTGVSKTLLDWFPSIIPLITLLFVLVVASISTLGQVPDDPLQQRTIALYAVFAAIFPWINPLRWLHQYVMYKTYSPIHTLIVLLCAVAGIVLILFSVKLVGMSHWGKIVNTRGKQFWFTQMVNVFNFVLMASAPLFVGSFYLSAVLSVINTLNGTYTRSANELLRWAFQLQAWSILVTAIVVLIVYALLGGLLKPFIWIFNGVISLFPAYIPPKVDMPPAEGTTPTEAASKRSLDEKLEEYLMLGENSRFFQAAGFIVGIPLILVIGFFIFSKLTPSPASSLPTQDLSSGSLSSTPDLFQLWNTLPPTNTPVIAQATYGPTFTPNPATLTVGAAFTQVAVSIQSILYTSTPLPSPTRTATATPITTLTPTGTTLFLDKNQTCHEGPGKDFQEVTSLASGVRLPILATNTESNGWWLVLIRLSVSREAVCWIENGIVEGDANQIPVIEATP